MMMDWQGFAYPFYLWGLLLAPVFFALALWARRRRHLRVGSLYFWQKALGFAQKPPHRWRFPLPQVLAFLFPVLLVLTLAQPQRKLGMQDSIEVVFASPVQMRDIDSTEITAALNTLAAENPDSRLILRSGPNGRELPDLAAYIHEIHTVGIQHRDAQPEGAAQVRALLAVGARVAWVGTEPSGYLSPRLREFILVPDGGGRLTLTGVWSDDSGAWAAIRNDAGQGADFFLAWNAASSTGNGVAAGRGAVGAGECIAIRLPDEARPTPGGTYSLFRLEIVGQEPQPQDVYTIPKQLRCAVDEREFPELALFLRAAAGALLVAPETPCDIAFSHTVPSQLPARALVLISPVDGAAGWQTAGAPHQADAALSAAGRGRIPSQALAGLERVQITPGLLPPGARSLIEVGRNSQYWPFLAEGKLLAASGKVTRDMNVFWLAGIPQSWSAGRGFPLTLAWMLREISDENMQNMHNKDHLAQENSSVQSYLTSAYDGVSHCRLIGYIFIFGAFICALFFVCYDIKNLLHKDVE